MFRSISMPARRLRPRGWAVVAMVTAFAGLGAFLFAVRKAPPAAAGSLAALVEREPAFVGSAACRECHQVEWELWRGSDHDKAMDVATDETVLGDFDDAVFTYNGITSRFYRRDGKFLVHTEGPGGAMREFEITHVFGHDPMQQYLIPFPGGRLQTLNITWDVIEGRWFQQYPEQDIPPDDWLHWTRSAQNWNAMCAECHSTDLQKGYDPATDTYNTTWKDIDVGCEACHGPGARHVAWAEMVPRHRPDLSHDGLIVNTSDITSVQLVELCAPCHARRAELGDYDHRGGALLDVMQPSLLTAGLYHPDGQILDEVYVYGSFLQSKMYANGVTCSDCHDSHSLELRFTGNDLCAQCHVPAVYDTAEHHFHQQVHEGQPSDGALCVSCHMVEQPYMVIDWRADHSFRVPRPDLTKTIGTPNACSQCHTGESLDWVLDAYEEWYGETRSPHYGTTFAAARANDPAAREPLKHIASSPEQAAIVRATALALLVQLWDGGPLPTLETAVESDVALLRRVAAEHLPLRSVADVERLAPLLSDPFRAVRLTTVARIATVPRDLLTPAQQKAFDVALGEYRTAMAYTLDFASSNHNLGNLELALGDARAAERFYRAALAIDDLFFPAKSNLAVLLSEQGRYIEAEALLREILAAYPDNADVMYSLALLLVEMGRAADALPWLERAAERLPDHPRLHYNLGLLRQQLGQLDGAEAALRRALTLQPGNLDFLHALADHLLRRGRLDEAGAVADRIVTLFPDQPLGHRLRAMVEAGGDAQ